jgi:hypothetical protein
MDIADHSGPHPATGNWHPATSPGIQLPVASYQSDGYC